MLNPRHSSSPAAPDRTRSLVRIGRVSAVDGATYRARVQWGEDPACQSAWVRWKTAAAGDVKIWLPPTVGEEVEITSLDGDMRNAYISGSFFNDDNQPPSSDLNKVVICFKDGTRIEHDKCAGEMTITGLSQLIETITTVITNAQTTHNGDTNHTGDINNSGQLKQSGAAAFDGGISGSGGKSIDVNHSHREQGDGQATSGVL